MKMLSDAVSAGGPTKLRVAASMVFSECTTPFGRDVVPEVKITTEGSSGSRPAIRARADDGSAAPTASVRSQRTSDGVVGPVREQRRRREHDRRLGRCHDVAHLRGPGARRRDHHQRAEPQHRVDRDHRDDVVAGEHEHRVAGADAAAPLQRGDRAVDARRRARRRSATRPRSATPPGAGRVRPHRATRSTGSVPQCPAARKRAARRRRPRRRGLTRS